MCHRGCEHLENGSHDACHRVPDKTLQVYNVNGFYKLNWINGIEKWNTEGFSYFSSYFKFFEKLEGEGYIIGDSNSWIIEAFFDFQKISKFVNVDCIFLLVRNGIKTVNSNIPEDIWPHD